MKRIVLMSIILLAFSIVPWSEVEPQSTECPSCGRGKSQSVHYIWLLDAFYCAEGDHTEMTYKGYLSGQTGGCRSRITTIAPKTCWSHTRCSDCQSYYGSHVHSESVHRITACPGEDGELYTDDDHTWADVTTTFPIIGGCNDTYWYDWDNPGSCQFH